MIAHAVECCPARCARALRMVLSSARALRAVQRIASATPVASGQAGGGGGWGWRRGLRWGAGAEAGAGRRGGQRLEDAYAGKGDMVLHAAVVDAHSPASQPRRAAPPQAADGPPSIGVPDGGSAAHMAVAQGPGRARLASGIHSPGWTRSWTHSSKLSSAFSPFLNSRYPGMCE